MQTKFRVEQIFDKFKQQQKIKYREMLTSLGLGMMCLIQSLKIGRNIYPVKISNDWVEHTFPKKE